MASLPYEIATASEAPVMSFLSRVSRYVSGVHFAVSVVSEVNTVLAVTVG